MVPTSKICIMKSFVTLALACSLLLPAIAQQQPDYTNVSIAVRADRTYPNTITFTASGVPDLTPWQLANAPRAYHSYLWVFSDGDTLKGGPSITHTFAKHGNFGGELMLSSKYSTSGPPPAFRTAGTVGPGTLASTTRPGRILQTSTNHLIENQRNAPPYSVVRGDTNRLVVQYGNVSNITVPEGRILVFYNETGRPITDFEYIGVTNWANELFSEPTTSELNDIKASYPKNGTAYDLIGEGIADFTNCVTWKTGSLTPDEQRAMVVRFECSTDTLFDGNTFAYQTLWLPDSLEIKVSDHSSGTDMIAMLSHDPNNIVVSESSAWWGKGKRAETLRYTVNFQNEGDGAAETVQISIPMQKSWNRKSIALSRAAIGEQELDLHITDTIRNGKLIWTFNNVYLEGLQQPNKRSKKHTCGYLEFTVKTGGKATKKMVPNASIVFDRNTPVVTNRARTSFHKNKRFGIRAGVLWHDLGIETPFAAPFQYGVGNVFAELTLTPVRTGFFGFSHSVGVQHLQFLTNEAEVSAWQLDVAPVQVVRSIGWFRVEAGIPLQLSLRETLTVAGQSTSENFNAFGAGGQLNINVQPKKRGLYAGGGVRYSYLSSIAGTQDATYLMLRASLGWRF